MGALVASSSTTYSPKLVDTQTVGKLLACEAVTPATEQAPATRSSGTLMLFDEFLAQA